MSISSAHLVLWYHDAEWNVCIIIIDMFNVLKFQAVTWWWDSSVKIKEQYLALLISFQDITWQTEISILLLLLLFSTFSVLNFQALTRWHDSAAKIKNWPCSFRTKISWVRLEYFYCTNQFLLCAEISGRYSMPDSTVKMGNSAPDILALQQVMPNQTFLYTLLIILSWIIIHLQDP